MPPSHTKLVNNNNNNNNNNANTIRRSNRSKVPPNRFRPNITGEVPEMYSVMIRELAKKQSSNCAYVIESSAYNTLEDALQLVLEFIFDSAAKNAKKYGRKSIEQCDLQYAKEQINLKKSLVF